MAVWDRLLLFFSTRVRPVLAERRQTIWFKRIDAGAKAQGAGDYAGAERHYRGALKIARLMGKDSSIHASSLNYLGLMFHEQGRHDDAAPLLEMALALLEQQVGRGNPAFASQLLALANVYSAQGRHTDAEPLITHALNIIGDTIGSDHPEAARALEAHADLCRRSERSDEARRLDARATKIRRDWERRYPPDSDTNNSDHEPD